MAGENVYAPPSADLQPPAEVPSLQALVPDGVIAEFRKMTNWVRFAGDALTLGGFLVAVIPVFYFSGGGWLGLHLSLLLVVLGRYLRAQSAAVRMVLRRGEYQDLLAVLVYQRKFWRLLGMALVAVLAGVAGVVLFRVQADGFFR
jgi:hypothetical protein